MSKLDTIFRAAFSTPRDPCSREYKDGVLAALRYRLGESERVRCLYRLGTAQAMPPSRRAVGRSKRNTRKSTADIPTSCSMSL
ncbi:conserved hypothetical protein [Thiomonas sp. CB3]|nr:conserved hypothetical protein [Thiomonas sp. CB3]